MNTSLVKLFFASLLGTFFLALVTVTLLLNAGTAGYVNLYSPLGSAAAYGLLTYCLQDTGGSSLNPAVTVGLFLVRKVTAPALVANLIAEVIGAYLGVLVAHFLTQSPLLPPQGTGLEASLGELLGATVFVFAIVRAYLSQASAAVIGFVAGVALLVAITIAQAVSGGLLNPAIAIGIGAFHLSYLLMPLLGGGIGALLARLLQPSAVLPGY